MSFKINKYPNQIHPLFTHQKNQKIKNYTSFVILFLIIIIFISSLIILLGIYYWQWENKNVIKLSEKFPLPVLLVGKNFIWLNDYYKDLIALTNFNKYQYPGTELPQIELKKQIITKLIDREIIEETAKKYNINVSEDEINQEIAKIETTTPNQNLNDLTINIFGWSFLDFKERVIKFEILANKLNDFILKNNQWQQLSREEINNIENQLNAGVDFDSFGQTAGWFTKEDLGDELYNKLNGLSIGQNTSIIETNYGYYIFKLENKTNLTNNQESYELSQIFVKKFDLSDFLQEKIEQTKIYRFIKI